MTRPYHFSYSRHLAVYTPVRRRRPRFSWCRVAVAVVEVLLPVVGIAVFGVSVLAVLFALWLVDAGLRAVLVP